MDLSAREENGILTVSISGEIRAEDNPRLETFLDSLDVGSFRAVLIDIAGLEYVNSRAIGSLMALWKEAVSESVKVAAVEPPPLVARLLSAVGLYRLLPVYPDEDAARGALSGR